MNEHKKILVMGGSYFIGRVFCIMASRSEKYNITVLNRGSYPLNQPGISEIKCDRNDISALRSALSDKIFDAVIDFCSLRPNDSLSLLKILDSNAGHYVYISSCSILADSEELRDESFPYANDSTLMEYISGKLANEKDTLSYCQENSINYTILRPAFVYGPFNYAPRESFYFKHIFSGMAFPQPTDCKTKFSFVYVADIAKAIMEVIDNKNSAGKIFNLAAPEQITYEKYVKILKKVCEEEVNYYDVTIDKVERENIPIPFPISKNEIFCGDKITALLNFSYTPFDEGMKKTYNAFKPIYKK